MTGKTKDIALVVPTIRQDCLTAFIERWAALGMFDIVDLIVMEDNPTKTFKIEGYPVSAHLCWEDITDSFGEEEVIIPRRSDTVRSYAYWYAWDEGYKYIMTLDDDCYPPGEEEGFKYESFKQFVEFHLSCLENRSKWFNTLNDVKPRGFPYFNIGKRDDVIVNHGLWMNVIDYDAPTQLVAPRPEKFNFSTQLVPHGSYFPFCGMNAMWKAEYTPLMYHLLMGNVVKFGDDGQPSLEKLKFDRFGDIWCGIFMKKIADEIGKSISTGIPYIRHERASNPFTNLKKEAYGLEVNEKLWQYVDEWVPFGMGGPGVAMSRVEEAAAYYWDLGNYIMKYNEFEEHDKYFRTLGASMRKWADLFKKPVVREMAAPDVGKDEWSDEEDEWDDD